MPIDRAFCPTIEHKDCHAAKLVVLGSRRPLRHQHPNNADAPDELRLRPLAPGGLEAQGAHQLVEARVVPHDVASRIDVDVGKPAGAFFTRTGESLECSVALAQRCAAARAVSSADTRMSASFSNSL